jgi:hypothetical protein
MNILLSILIATLTIFALKRHNSKQDFGLGNKRFIIAIVCGCFPYLDNIFLAFDAAIQLQYKNTFLWSIVLTPIYALALTAIFKTIFNDKSDAKFLYIGVFGSMLSVVLFNALGSEELALFFPFSNTKFSLNIMYNFSLILFLIAATGIILIITLEKYRRDIARIFMVIFAIYVIAVASFSIKARFIADDYAKALNLEVEKVYVLAQPLSVFNWRIMILTKDNKMHDSFITLRNEQLKFADDDRTNRVAKLYKPAKSAVWRIYRKVNPRYTAQYNAVQEYYGDNKIVQNILKFSILKDAINYSQYRCLRFKDLRTEGIRKSLKGYTLFCQNPKTKNIKILSGDKDEYNDISSLFN